MTKSQEGKWADTAALYRKALAARRKQSPDDPRRWDDDVNALANALNEQQQFAETDRVLTELLVAANDSDPRAARLWNIRGSSRARRGQWREAWPDLSRSRIKA